MYETSCQSRFYAQYWMLGAGALGRPRGMVWGGRREEGSGWGTHAYLWQIHFDIWQNLYNYVKFKNKIKKKIFFVQLFCVFLPRLLNHQGNTYLNHNEISPHTCKKNCYQ